MTIRVFPVKALPNPPDEYNGRGGRCSKRVWWRDWHNVSRRNAAGERVAHHAQDIFAPSGSRVVAPEDGVIIGSSASTGPTPRGGHWLRLLTDNRVYFMSHLLDSPDVTAGQDVRAGQVLGRVGKTGNAATTCPHLHIGARKRIGRTQRGGMAINIASELAAAEASPGVSPVEESDVETPTPEDDATIEEPSDEPASIVPITVPGRLPVTTGPVPPLPADAVSPNPTARPPAESRAKGAALSWLWLLVAWVWGLLFPRARNDRKRR